LWTDARARPTDTAPDSSRADERARADAGGEEPLGGEAFVGDGDRVARDAEAGREVARGWQAVARAQAAVEDRGPELPVDAGRAVAGAGEADVDIHDWPNHLGFHWHF
jgi:hypothetical protein